jgi:hypothetical protein
MRYGVLALMAGLAACLPGCLPQPVSECSNDSQCGDDVCARTGECVARVNVREVTVKWTVNGSAADATSCAAPDLYLQFEGSEYGDTLRFAPVPCRAGSYTIDKLPKRYVQVELGIAGGPGDVSPIDATTGRAHLDLLQ